MPTPVRKKTLEEINASFQAAKHIEDAAKQTLVKRHRYYRDKSLLIDLEEVAAVFQTRVVMKSGKDIVVGMAGARLIQNHLTELLTVLDLGAEGE